MNTPMVLAALAAGQDLRAEVSGSLIGRLTQINKPLGPSQLMKHTFAHKKTTRP